MLTLLVFLTNKTNKPHDLLKSRNLLIIQITTPHQNIVSVFKTV